jgi:hypothetical protein
MLTKQEIKYEVRKAYNLIKEQGDLGIMTIEDAKILIKIIRNLYED